MKKLAQLLNEMKTAGVIQNYALFGATAQMRYTEPVASLAQRHGLKDAWKRFEARFLDG